MGPILLHEHCLQEGIRAVMERALTPRYGGRTVLYATISNGQVESLFVQEFDGYRSAVSGAAELFSMRWRDPLERVDPKKMVERALDEKPMLVDKFTEWLLQEGWDETSIHQLPFSVRHREFSRAFPHRWEQIQSVWRDEQRNEEWESFEWSAYHQELQDKGFLVTPKAPICPVIQDVSK